MSDKILKITYKVAHKPEGLATLWKADSSQLPGLFQHYDQPNSSHLCIPGLGMAMDIYHKQKSGLTEEFSTVQEGDWVLYFPSIGYMVVTSDFFNQHVETIGELEDPRNTLPMRFGSVITHLENGRRAARHGWNGKGMFIYLVEAQSYPVQTQAAKAFFGENAMVPYNAYFAIKNQDNSVSTWVPSVNDCLAKDWYIL